MDEVAPREKVREHELAPGDEVTVAGIVTQVEELIWVNGESLMLQPALGLTAN